MASIFEMEAERILQSGTPDELLQLLIDSGDARPDDLDGGKPSYRKRAARRLANHPHARTEHLAEALVWPTFADRRLWPALKARVGAGDLSDNLEGNLRHMLEVWSGNRSRHPVREARRMLEQIKGDERE